MAYKRLGDILIDGGAITPEQLQSALVESKKKGQRIGEYLISSGIITEQQLIKVLSIQLGVDFIDLNKQPISQGLARTIPQAMARHYNIIPVNVTGDAIYLAMEDPLNFRAIDEVRQVTRGKRVIPMIATRDAVQRAIINAYGNEGMTKAISNLQESIGNSGDMEANVQAAMRYQSADEDAAPTIRLVNSILERAIVEKSSDIHLEPREHELSIRMRIDGVLHTTLSIPKNLQSAVIARIKIMGEMDIAERRIPQDGRAQLRVQERDFDLRISTIPTIYGEKVVVRFLEKSSAILTNANIGLTGKHLDDFESLIHNANGVILISGPTGSGKSTTMSTMITELANDSINVMTLEDPVEYNIPGVNQIQVNEKVGMDFASGLRSILRQDPDVIAVGEIRDAETAEIAMRSAITGHLVFSTIHTNSAIATLDRLLDIGIEPYLISGALKGVIAQRLVRKICPRCRMAYRPTPEQLAVLEISPEQGRNLVFYKGKGCPDCLNTGYRGRTGVFEILTLTSEIKEKFRERAPHRELVNEIMKSGFSPMLNDCRRLVLNGVTSIEEAEKILHTTDG